MRWLLGGLWLAVVGGCVAPERSPLFEVDWEEQTPPVRADADADADTAGPVPGATEPPGMPQPDADGVLALSVEDAVMLALHRNRSLRVEQQNPVIAGAFELLERGAFDPEAFAEFSFGRNRASEVDRGTGEQFGVEARDFNSVAGLRQNLPSGTEVELSVSQSRDASDRSPEQQEAELGFTLTQALLRGRGPAVNLAAIRQARLETLASEHELRGFAEALVADTQIAYWNLALVREQIDIVRESLGFAQRQLDDARERIDVGTLPLAEAAAFEAEVARREQALIDAEALAEQRGLDLLQLLSFAGASSLGGAGASVGDAAGASTLVTPITTSATRLEPAALEDVPDRLRLALARRAELGEARALAQRDRLETVQTRNGLLPRLDLFARLGKTGFSDSFGGSLEAVGTEDTFEAVVGARFSRPLGNDAARGADLAAHATRVRSARAIENLEELVLLDVRSAVVELERARRNVEAFARLREAQQAVLTAEEDRFDAGVSTSLLVAQAQRDLLAARVEEVAAVVSYRVALISLHRAEGSGLARRGLGLRPTEGPDAAGGLTPHSYR